VVDRVPENEGRRRRIHQNDGENVPLFLLGMTGAVLVKALA